MMKIQKIISGGQTGVDRAALDFALENEIPCGGWCPKGRLSEDGSIPPKYPLQEASTEHYPQRTEMNVRESDGTLVIFEEKMDRGTLLTVDLCKKHHKPFFELEVNNHSEKVRMIFSQWVSANGISVLNVAGNRENFSLGIHKKTIKLLQELFA
jgi:predicted Rossmann-fold nucleotide-binding protein